MKKLFAILMSIMMIACFMPTMAFAANLSGSVTIEGTAKFGQTLTANVTKVTGNGAEELKYQWKRGDADIDVYKRQSQGIVWSADLSPLLMSHS